MKARSTVPKIHPAFLSASGNDKSAIPIRMLMALMRVCATVLFNWVSTVVEDQAEVDDIAECTEEFRRNNDVCSSIASSFSVEYEVLMLGGSCLGRTEGDPWFVPNTMFCISSSASTSWTPVKFSL